MGGDARVVARCVGHGPTVVLLHGGSGSWNHWVRTMPALARRFRVVALDLPGFGDSSLPERIRSAHDLAGATSEAIAGLVPEGGHGLVGFSFGGIIAGLVAARPRARVTRLVLIGAGGLGLPSGVERPLVPVAADSDGGAARRAPPQPGGVDDRRPGQGRRSGRAPPRPQRGWARFPDRFDTLVDHADRRASRLCGRRSPPSPAVVTPSPAAPANDEPGSCRHSCPAARWPRSPTAPVTGRCTRSPMRSTSCWSTGWRRLAERRDPPSG